MKQLPSAVALMDADANTGPSASGVQSETSASPGDLTSTPRGDTFRLEVETPRDAGTDEQRHTSGGHINGQSTVF
jgi:hypothetical protein